MRRSNFTLASMMLLTLLCIAVSLSAAWVENMPETFTQPDGTVVEFFSSGDEYHHWAHDAEGYKIVKDKDTGFMCWATIQNDTFVSSGHPIHLQDPKSIAESTTENISAQGYHNKRERWNELAGRSTFSPTRAAPTSGNLINLVVFMKFQDQTDFPDGYSVYDYRFNETGADVSSMKQYYASASYGQLSVHSPLYPNPNNDVIVSYTAPYDFDYVRNLKLNQVGYTTWCDMLRAALASVASQVTQTAEELDANGDGRIDNVFFIIRGIADKESEFLWSHRWGLALGTDNVTVNGKKPYDYIAVMENHAMASGPVYGIAVLVHEYGHTLGAPDFYTYSAVTPIGVWECMANVTNPPQAFTSYVVDRYYKWISVPDVVKSGTYTLTPFPDNQSGSALRIRTPYAANQFFMVENRQKRDTLTDSTIPGSGLLISRCVPQLNGNVPDAPTSVPYELYVYRPGGDIWTNGNVNEAAYGVDGRTAINDYTSPSSFIYQASGGNGVTNAGVAGGLDISEISLDPVTQNVTLKINMRNEPKSVSSSVADGNKVTVRWTAPTLWGSPSGYRVYRNGELITLNNLSSISRSYVDNAPVHGSNEYTVTAVYNSNLMQGESAYSEPTTANIFYEMESPRDLIATELADTINGVPTIMLQWTTVGVSDGFTGYKVYRDNVAISEVIADVTYNDSDVTHSTSYTYYVTAVYRFGESEPSNTVSITTATPPPPPPTELYPPQNLIVVSTPGKLVLHWEAPEDSPNAENLVYYKIYRNDKLLRMVNAETLHYHDVVAIISMRYTYHVTAEYTNGTSPASNSVTATVLHPNVWLPARDLTATEGQGEVVLSWSAPTPAVHSATLAGYMIYRDGDAFVEVGNTLEYSDTDVVAGVEYSYQVAAMYVNPDGASILSNTVTAIPLEIEVDFTLYPPQNLTATSGHRQVILAWDAPEYINPVAILKGYIVYRNGEPIGQTDSPEYIDTTAVINIRYTYHVVAVYSSPEGISEPSNSVIGKAIISPMSPQGMTALHENYPNPFNPETTISFSLANDTVVQIEICNIKGQVVKSLLNRHMSAGTHSVVWDGQDNHGNTVSSGMYFYRMTAGEHQSIRKMLLMK